jgi:hypothetical protein
MNRRGGRCRCAIEFHASGFDKPRNPRARVFRLERPRKVLIEPHPRVKRPDRENCFSGYRENFGNRKNVGLISNGSQIIRINCAALS